MTQIVWLVSNFNGSVEVYFSEAVHDRGQNWRASFNGYRCEYFKKSDAEKCVRDGWSSHRCSMFLSMTKFQEDPISYIKQVMEGT